MADKEIQEQETAKNYVKSIQKRRRFRGVKSIEDLVIANNPKSSFAEAIKSIKTNLIFSSIEKELKVILVTSPEPGDGKSFIVANLATAFAQDDKNVLIIDGDMRRGRQHEIFHIPNKATHGYSNYILRYKNTNDNSMLDFVSSEIYIQQTKMPNVSLLPAGPTPPNPLELISSDNNRRLIDDLRKKYDIILIDCPPALGLSDALVMSKYSDANIVTVSSDKTKLDQLESVKKNFAKVNSKISGVIINKIKAKKGSSYSSYYTNEYYTKLNK
ncbi:CpsD/CapB family tyrosine-protein kinase [Candidatus Saccharibacteria bacterium]|nr:CpsD/CapB family tyrosine-protein kinase [Candidatus Saccharibacteria bacterium]